MEVAAAEQDAGQGLENRPTITIKRDLQPDCNSSFDNLIPPTHHSGSGFLEADSFTRSKRHLARREESGEFQPIQPTLQRVAERKRNRDGAAEGHECKKIIRIDKPRLK